jgi:hypothetical protein
LGLKSILARTPPEFTGESKKTLRGSELSRFFPGSDFGAGEYPLNVIRFSAKPQSHCKSVPLSTAVTYT